MVLSALEKAGLCHDSGMSGQACKAVSGDSRESLFERR